MDQGENTVLAPSDANGGGGLACEKVLGKARCVCWGSEANSHWGKLKPYQKRKFSTYEEVFKRR